ncbi:MAG: beta-propeller fold lactonase family protein [Edaphobacter sp.]|uniref:lactonase family protein n=1 Tax=Edaphobacter sp. TaxID=1934404 RepID=UPI00239CF241|nr:beta-propeller fold lactonase family protein [Edaphobacter sp.]MDE1176254.1 beta-propeller fold lactonase family protein [Edaphobacter sp.]
MYRFGATGALAALFGLSGCGQFFVPENNDSGGGTTGTARVYVANSTTGTLAAFTVGTNALSAVSGSPFSLGYAPLDAVVTPSNSFVYVAGPDAIYAYAIASDGTISSASGGSGGAAVAVATVASLAVSPDGQWLFGLDSTSTTLDEYQINTSTGALTAVGTIPYTVSSGTPTPRMVRVSPLGNLIFAAVGSGGDIVFTLNTSSGAVVNSQTLTLSSTQTSDNALAINSTGAYLYIARSGTNGGVAVYTIGTNGALSAISGSPFAAGSLPSGLVIDSTGKYLYAANRTDGTISGYTIGTGSALTALAGSPFTAGTEVLSLALDSSGDYLLAGSYGGSPDLSMYSFDTTTLGKLNLATSAATDTDPAGVIAVAATH